MKKPLQFKMHKYISVILGRTDSSKYCVAFALSYVKASIHVLQARWFFEALSHKVSSK